MTESAGIELFGLREKAVFTSYAHMEYEKRIRENIRQSKIWLKVATATCWSPLAAVISRAGPRFQLLSATATVASSVATAYISTDVETQTAEMINANHAATAWMHLADDMAEFEHQSKGPCYKSADLESFKKQRKLLHSQTPRTNNDAYQAVKNDLNKTWYSDQVIRYEGMGKSWEGIAQHSRQLAEKYSTL